MQPGGLFGYLGWVGSARFSPDGRCVVTSSGVAAQVWDAATGEPLTPPLKSGGSVVSTTAFSADGRRLTTAGDDQTVRVWSLEPNDWPLEDLVLLGQLLTGRQIDDTGALVPLEHPGGTLSPGDHTRESLRHAWEALRARHAKSFTFPQ